MSSPSNAIVGFLFTVLLFAFQASPQVPYSPPAASAGAFQGIPLSSGRPIGEQFQQRFAACDATDHCQGKKVKFGCTSDPSRNTVLLRLPGNVIFFDAKLALDADGSPLSRKRPGATDQSETSFRYPLKDRPSVDSDKVPFIVMPEGFAESLGIELGDIAAVVYKDRVVYSLVADTGPPCKIGEGSIELHERLGHRVCLARDASRECTKLQDTSIEADVCYLIFAGSKSRIMNGLTPSNTDERLLTEGSLLVKALRTAKKKEAAPNSARSPQSPIKSTPIIPKPKSVTHN